MTTAALVPVQAGTIDRQEMGSRQLTRSAETTTSAAAARAEATVKARYSMAVMRPRDMDDVRQRVLKEARRPGFAQVARYSKPMGGKPVVGPSIRFAEAAARLMGNIDIDCPVTFEDDDKRIVRCTVTDLEGNTTYSKDVTVTKSVERKSLKAGQVPLGQRINSYGDKVFLVAATDDDLLVKQAALESKAIRTLLLRLIPGDIVEEAMTEVVSTLQKTDAADPDAARKQVADAFARLGVMPAELAKYLGHDLGTCSPAELTDLRAVYNAIKDGESTWAATMATKDVVDAPQKGAAGVKAALAKKAPPVVDVVEREVGEEG